MGTRSPGVVTQVITGAATGESSVLVHRRRERFDGSAPLVLYAHGVNSSEVEPLFYRQGLNLPAVLATHGYIVLAGLWGATAGWGNATAIARMEEARAWAQANGAKAGAIGLWGVSMGFMAVANYWNTYPANVGAAFGIVPVSNASNVYADNAGLQAGMNAAYGGDFATNGAPRSPHLILPNIAGAGAKTRLHYSSVDATIRAADVTALASAIGATAIDVEPANPSGHSSWISPTHPEDAVVAHFHARLK